MKTLALATMLVTTTALAGPSHSFDRKAWREDYAALKHELEQSYSHLAWAASPASGVDLPSLDHRTRWALDAARSDADASAALVSFVAGFHDGHLAIGVTPEQAGAIAEPPSRCRIRGCRFVFRTACVFAPMARTKSRASLRISQCCQRQMRVRERARRACSP